MKPELNKERVDAAKEYLTSDHAYAVRQGADNNGPMRSELTGTRQKLDGDGNPVGEKEVLENNPPAPYRRGWQNEEDMAKARERSEKIQKSLLSGEGFRKNK